MILKTRLLAATGVIAVSAFTGSAAQAAGFYIKEQSVTGLGRAFAGESAVGEDASTIFFNPAALTELEQGEIQAGVHLLIPNADFENDGSTVTPFGLATSGGDGGNPYDPTPVPNLFAAVPLQEGRLWLGLGVTAPFGLANEYDDDWFGRYDSIETELTTINVAPTVAYRVNDWLSVGGGIDIQYADAKLTNAVPTSASADDDLIGSIEGDDFSVGFNIGALFKPLPTTRIGVHYRSAVSHDLEGTGELVTRGGVPVLSEFAGSAELDLPDIAAIGVAHELTPKLTLLGEVNWYGWSNFERITVINEDAGNEFSRVEQGYENTYSLAVGAQYAVNDNWTVRGGFQYDETPTTDEFRTTRTPDGDRYWLAAGVSYELNESFVIDAAYAHIFIEDAEVDVTRDSGATSVTRGTSEGSVDILSVGLRYRF